MVLIKQQVVHSFNKSARSYDSAATVQTHVAKRLAEQLNSVYAHTILEIGCGTGLLSQFLYQRFPTASLLLTDIAPAMVNACRQRFVEQARIKLFCMDGENLTLETPVDLIISSMALHWFNNIHQSIKKIIDHVSQKGQFIFSLLGNNSLHEWRALCKDLNVPAGTPHFPNKIMLQQLFPEIKLEVESYQQSYATVYEFLNSLKQVGATATYAGYIPLSPRQLRNIIRSYNKEIHITYEVIYGVYTKNEKIFYYRN